MYDRLKKALMTIGKKSVRDGLVIDAGGNISCRKRDTMIVKAKGTKLNSSSLNGYAEVDIPTGRIIAGIPSSEKYMHLECYRARKDIGAVLHFHPVFSTALANSKLKLGTISYECAASVCSEMIRSEYRPSGSKALAKEIRRCVKKCNVVLMPNHGIMVVGENAARAYARAIAAERAAMTLIFSRILGVFNFLPAKEAKRIIDIYRKDTRNKAQNTKKLQRKKKQTC